MRLIPPQYVKPYLKRGKNDRNDAEAICEAAGHPGMRFVAVKTEDQQAEAMVLKVRATLVEQCTQLINAMRGHAAEFIVISGRGTGKVTALLATIAADTAIPPVGQEILALLGEQLGHLDCRIKALEAMHKADTISQLLATVPGIGPIMGGGRGPAHRHPGRAAQPCRAPALDESATAPAPGAVTRPLP